MNLLTKIFNRFKPELHIYTDGSHKGKWGAWAFVVTKNGRILHEASGRVSRTNCNRMEFQAAIEALSYLKPGDRARIFSDSRVLIQAMNETQNDIQGSEDQLHTLSQLTEARHVTWSWIKAHAGLEFNERCDELCIAARELHQS